jgi:hypothetical protein
MGRFQNKKTLKIYDFVAFATDATNERDGLSVVIYKDANGQHYVREALEFTDKFHEITCL